MRRGPGLIVGSEVVSLFPDLESAARHAAGRFPGREVLIKKVAATSPVQSLGGAVLEPRPVIEGVIG